jgi:hypothetical protein
MGFEIRLVFHGFDIFDPVAEIEKLYFLLSAELDKI